MCHCLVCRPRTGSAFSIQARFPSDRVQIAGRSSTFVRVWDDGDTHHACPFCPACGATGFFTGSGSPESIAAPIGAFGDPSFPTPTVSVFETRRHPWVAVPAAFKQYG
jgi:hypothetical protein